MSNEEPSVKLILEGALLAAGKPMNLEQLAQLFDEHKRPDKPTLKAALEAIAADCEGRGFELKEVASGWRFQVRQALSPWVGRLWEEKPQRYTRAMLETLALVAYRQPITRGEIEDIRGVSVSSNIMRTLQERDWVRIVGHRDVPGRPAMFATTRQFLDYFNLQNLDELPPLSEIRNLDAMAASLEGDVAALPETVQQALQGLDTEGGGSEESVSTEQASKPESLVAVAQQFQEESEQNVVRLFAELDDLEDGLKTTFTDFNPRDQDDVRNDAEGIETDEAVRVEITYDTHDSGDEIQSFDEPEQDEEDSSSIADLRD
ncbi:SMC-Scp complex subunit ScpB [Kistimonas asteriae]|uniref:SMC-Scp complex subunit ScpB n=1 Tax=Kistimonas asteriae TaxID=517724 RepID=UPI001BAA57F8|nr:SMC-Scp complex subunit ScpB [Kistimonas asteriae]